MNGRRAKRASNIHAGDRVRVRKGPYDFHIVVIGLSERRGPASEARELYEEAAESVEARDSLRRQRRAAPKFSFKEGGKPSKKERRQLRQLKDNSDD